MKVLISGIVGAAVATAAWLVLEHITQLDLGWLACLVGLVTGISIHLAAGPNARESFGRGALAVLLTLAACAGGRMLYAQYMRSIGNELNVKIAKTVETEETDDEQDAIATDEVIEQESVVSREDLAPESLRMQKPTIKETVTEKDMLWLCLAALAAYITGKGRDNPPAEAIAESQGQAPPAAEHGDQGGDA